MQGDDEIFLFPSNMTFAQWPCWLMSTLSDSCTAPQRMNINLMCNYKWQSCSLPTLRCSAAFVCSVLISSNRNRRNIQITILALFLASLEQQLQSNHLCCRLGCSFLQRSKIGWIQQQAWIYVAHQVFNMLHESCNVLAKKRDHYKIVPSSVPQDKAYTLF